jgi:hypothetical protein
VKLSSSTVAATSLVGMLQLVKDRHQLLAAALSHPECNGDKNSQYYQDAHIMGGS